MARADVLLPNSNSSMRDGAQSNDFVRLSDGTLYRVFIGSDLVLYWTKSSNDGVTWTPPTLIKNAVIRGVDVWYDQWTTGNAGTVIHIAYVDATAHDVFYRALDTSGDGLGSEITIFAGASAVSGSVCVSIARMRGGNLLCQFDIDGGTEIGFYRSTDAGATWAAGDGSGAMTEATFDYFIVMPGNETDNQDGWVIYWDRSADEISLKVFDNSANALGSETSIAGTMADGVNSTAAPHFAAAVATSTVGSLTQNHLYLVAWSAVDTLNADLRFWDINGAASITEGTNVVLNSTDDQGCCTIGLDMTDGTVTVGYIGLSNGSETAFSAISVNMKQSTDGGSTWGSETAVSTANRAHCTLSAAPIHTSGEYVLSYGATFQGSNMLQYISAILPDAGGGGAGPLVGGRLVQ